MLMGLLSLKLDLAKLPHRHCRLPCPVSFLDLLRDALLQHLQTSQVFGRISPSLLSA